MSGNQLVCRYKFTFTSCISMIFKPAYNEDLVDHTNLDYNQATKPTKVNQSNEASNVHNHQKRVKWRTKKPYPSCKSVLMNNSKQVVTNQMKRERKRRSKKATPNSFPSKSSYAFTMIPHLTFHSNTQYYLISLVPCFDDQFDHLCL